MYQERAVYHLYNKSIAKYVIYNRDEDYARFRMLLAYYRVQQPDTRFSYFLREGKEKKIFINPLEDIVTRFAEADMLVNIIAYCIMPTHFHLVLEECVDGGISRYASNVLNSYTRYFNIRYKRKGPLWTGRSKKVLLNGQEQYLHVTRYVHINPVTDYIVEKPEEWQWSSYREWMNTTSEYHIAEKKYIDMDATEYKSFCEERIDYQRELAYVKKLGIEE